MPRLQQIKCVPPYYRTQPIKIKEIRESKNGNPHKLIL